jgi:DNA-binding transcriptional LysR family regulator
MDWDRVRVFLAVARSTSLRAAGESLNVTHATIARALNGLETELGARLFDRGRVGLSLTEAGAQLIGSAERMEREADAIQRRAQGLDAKVSGRLRVSVPPFHAYKLLAPHFASFIVAYPDIDLQVDITYRIADLARREADVSIRAAYEVGDDVVGRRLIRYLKCVYASPAYLATVPDLEVGDGAGAVWIGWSETETQPAWVRESPFPRAALRHVMPEVVMQVEAAASGIGLSYRPCFIGDADPRLARAPGVEPVEDRSIWLLLHDDLRRTARVRAFVDFMAEHLLKDRAALRGEGGRYASG